MNYMMAARRPFICSGSRESWRRWWSALLQLALLLGGDETETVRGFKEVAETPTSSTGGKLLRKHEHDGTINDKIGPPVQEPQDEDHHVDGAPKNTRPRLHVKNKSLPTALLRVARNSAATGGDGRNASAEGKQLLCALRDSVEFASPPWGVAKRGGAASSGGGPRLNVNVLAPARNTEEDLQADEARTSSSEQLLLKPGVDAGVHQEQEDASTFYRPPLLGKSCAIVSSSGAMLLHEYGHEIDAHDFVLRMNRAPTRRFEKHVGKRESIRVGWDSPPFVRQFCREQTAAFNILAATAGNKRKSRAAHGRVQNKKDQQEEADGTAAAVNNSSHEMDDETVYIMADEIPHPECTQMQNKQAELKEAVLFNAGHAAAAVAADETTPPLFEDEIQSTKDHEDLPRRRTSRTSASIEGDGALNKVDEGREEDDFLAHDKDNNLFGNYKNTSKSSTPIIRIPSIFIKTFQNVDADTGSLGRFLLDVYGPGEAQALDARTTDPSSGAKYGVMLLGYCDHVDFYEKAPSKAALGAINHYFSRPDALLDPESDEQEDTASSAAAVLFADTGVELVRRTTGRRSSKQERKKTSYLDQEQEHQPLSPPHDVQLPSTENEPWGQGAEMNSWHGLLRAEHDFFRRVAMTPAEESLRTGKLRIQGLATLTDEDCRPG
ncbi:unnamed protein product [Amoebophrya sp. A120]|nr:unnamed protein product [Amoebophrya sp. A120]|eukprot:GSA120T00018215001.1